MATRHWQIQRCSPPDAKTQVVAKKSKKTASLGGWEKTAKKITEQLCDIKLTQDSFLHKVGTSLRAC